MKIKLTFVATILSGVIVTSCVSPRVVEDIKKKNAQIEKENAELKALNESLKSENTEITAELVRLKKEISGLQRDTSIQGISLRKIIVNYDKLNEQYNEMLRNTEKMLAGSESETRKALRELQTAQEKLQEKEDKLRILDAELKEERARLDKLSAKLDEREKKVNELTQILREKEETVTKLREKISQALRGFEGSGLTVVEKNGKVYVSMDERLLFASGSTTVDSRGRQAIVELGRALEKEPDINVMIEGHTDNVPLSGSGPIKDNWDLSVLRATSIAKILLENKNISPSRVIVAGRGEHQPVAPNDTRENRAKNRRTEIILTPKLNELFKILEN